MAQYAHLPIYNLAFDLLKELYQRVPKFARQYKYTLGERLLNANIEAIHLILEANNTRDKGQRRELLSRLVWQVESIIIHVRIANALQFEYNREKNLFELLEDLQQRTYTISRHIYFIVTNPTPREIFAADFRDRIVHHLLCAEIQWLFERDFIERSYANRVGKGTHRAVCQLQEDLRCVRREYPAGKYYLKLDIENFFRSIDHKRLYTLITARLRALPTVARGVGSLQWREEVLWLARHIIFHDPTTNYVYQGDPDKRCLIPAHKSLFSGRKGAGLPIGNLTSQLFANVYLHELDLYITKTLGQRIYLRYVDDFVIIDTNRATLLALRAPVDAFLREMLGLRLHPKKTVCQTGGRGVDFLGYIVRANYILVRQSVVKRLRQRLRTYERQYASCYVLNHSERALQAGKLQATVASYLGHVSHAQSVRLQQAIQTITQGLDL